MKMDGSRHGMMAALFSRQYRLLREGQHGLLSLDDLAAADPGELARALDVDEGRCSEVMSWRSTGPQSTRNA